MASQAELVKQLRDRTGAGVMDCKVALEATEGDLPNAIEFLRKKGLADAAKRQHREAKEGAVAAYIHPGARIGVLVELDCETDFVARTGGFQQLVKDVAMQVAATNPAYVGRDDVPPGVVDKEREIYQSQADAMKPAAVIEKIIEGKLETFYADQCLLEQPFIKDTSGQTRVKDLVAGATAQTGERIVVKRFCRFQIGEGV